MLKIEGLCAGYGPIEVLHEVSIEAKSAEVVSILGSNGAGKSTLLKTISGILTPTKGSISIEDIVINGSEPSKIVKMGVVHVPEGRHIFPGLTVKDNLLLGGYFRNTEDNKKNMELVMSTFPILKDRLNERAGMLSGGEQQRVAIARALIMEPEILLADEPIGNLDTQTGKKIEDILLELNITKHIILVVVTHNKSLADRMSRSIGLRDGKIVTDE